MFTVQWSAVINPPKYHYHYLLHQKSDAYGVPTHLEEKIQEFSSPILGAFGHSLQATYIKYETFVIDH